MKKCKNCKESFNPLHFNQKYCFKKECTNVWIESEKEKQWKKKKAKIKQELMTKSDYVKILQQLVNKYVRERDGNFCISCNKKVSGKIDAGHMFSVGNYPSVRFDLRNINSQCIKCNQYNGGSLLEYRENLIKKIGLKDFEDLEFKAHQNRQYTINEIKDLIQHYKGLLKNI